MIARNKTLVFAAALAASLAGISQIEIDEGFGPTSRTEEGDVVAEAYADPAHGWNVPTICNGRTKGVFQGQTATLEQCREWLVEDVSDSGRAIKRCTPVEMTQGQYDALTRLVHNIGQGAYCSSAIAREINAGNCTAAAKEFNAMPQIDRKTKRPRIWTGKSIKDRRTGAVLLATGAPIMKWTTANHLPLPGLILRRASERAEFEMDCDVWRAIQ